MYLFVFVFIMISIMGIYVELFALQMARFNAGQKTLAEAMMVWHGAAVDYVRDNATEAAGFGAVCSLTDGYTNYAYCYSGGSAFTLPEYSGSPGTPDYLPQGYNYAQLKWDSLFYRDSSGVNTTHFLVTFIRPGDANRRMGFTADQVYSQLKNTDFPKISYGRIADVTCLGGSAGHWFVTNEYVNGRQICFPVPNGVPAGSAGIITNLGF